MASDGMSAKRLAEITAALKNVVKCSGLERSDAIWMARDLLAELARVAALNDRLSGKMCLVCGAAQPCTATPEACTFDPNPIDAARAFLARAAAAEARNVRFIGELGTALAKLDAAEAKLDRVWSALGITTVPVGMDVGEKVRELAELNAVNAAGADRAMAAAEAASSVVAALTEQLRVATEWRDISTLPRNAEAILYDPPVWSRSDKNGPQDIAARMRIGRDDVPRRPTHWLPLPSPPPAPSDR